ncbi:MAG: DUF2157 domain-containing protein [Candidatus Eisenbacteria bacterium]|nr:DUF2157 domain-containing protein [Candidatus Eisenbacteria bacterium]
MDLFDFAGQAFRQRLRQELGRWRDEGLIDAPTAEAIAARYAHEESGAKTTAAAVYVLGSMLLGGGVLSLVAWNWHALGTPTRLGLVLLALFAAQISGHRAGMRGRDGLGHALLLLGSVLFGGCLFVISRHYDQGIDWPLGLLLWGLAGLSTAWLFLSPPSAIFGQILATVWVGYQATHGGITWLAALAQIGIALPLVRRTGSTTLLLVTLIAIAFSLGFSQAKEHATPGSVLVPVLAWAITLLSLSASTPRDTPLSRTAAAAGLFVGGLVTYFLSFRDIGRESGVWARHDDPAWSYLIPTALCLAVAGFLLLRRAHRERPAAIVGAGSLFLLLIALHLKAIPGSVAIAANVALAATAITGVAGSVQQLRRAPFWFGTLTLGILIVTRFFEYQGNLLGKAIAFILCGLLAIWAGSAFERRVERDRGRTEDAG